MTLAEFRILVDAPAKWILNARAQLGPSLRYTLGAAERLALARHLNLTLGIPLRRAWKLARESLAGTTRDSLALDQGLVTLNVNVQRLKAALAARQAQIANQPTGRRAGRKPARPSDAIAVARAYGIDVTLLEANLQLSPLERLRQLDGMHAFSAAVRRKR